MQITITTGTGEGPTPRAAFDAALLSAGVANYNLVHLSSIIPAGSFIQRAKYVMPYDEYGHQLYVAMARQEACQAGQVAWAGLGWTQEVETGRGLFVDIYGLDRAQVERDIRASLQCMMVNRPLRYGMIESVVAGVECPGRPVCALAIAIYHSQRWA
jgi:arginine decarboxylase